MAVGEDASAGVRSADREREILWALASAGRQALQHQFQMTRWEILKDVYT